jgi:endoglucanase Acf2
MLYETMASFQTWFAGGDMVSIGIQLLPFTPVSERRDNPEWVLLAYKPFEKSCYSDKDFCVKNGWSILLCGLKATIGDREEARKDALTIPEKVFLSDGGDGHSRSNLIWYVATRPDVLEI